MTVVFWAMCRFQLETSLKGLSICYHYRPEDPIGRTPVDRGGDADLVCARHQQIFSRCPALSSHCFSVSEKVAKPAAIFSAAGYIPKLATRTVKLPASPCRTTPREAMARACCRATALETGILFLHRRQAARAPIGTALAGISPAIAGIVRLMINAIDASTVRIRLTYYCA